MTIGSDVTTVNACEDKSDWTGVTHSNPDDNTSGSAVPIFREGSGCMQATAAQGNDGYWWENTAFDMTGEVLVFWIWFSGPTELGSTDDVSVIIADGAGVTGTVGRWSFFAPLEARGGGWFPAVVWPTQPDEGSAPTVNSIDSVGLDVDNAPGTLTLQLVGWDYIHRMSQMEISAQTVTMQQIADQDITDDLGVFTGLEPNFKCQVNLQLGAAATTTTWAEVSKALNFASANRDHDIGFIFVDGTTGGTFFTCGEFVGGQPLNGPTFTWTTGDTVGARGGEVFTNPANCDVFRLFGSTFLDLATDGSGHDIELPAFISNEGALGVTLVAGGTGYAVNDVLTGVSGTGTKATATVTSVSSGVITGLSLTTEGDYTVPPNATDTTTVAPSGGSGATVSWTMIDKKTCLGNTFNNMGEVDIGDLQFENNNIIGATSGVLYAGTGTRRAKNNTYIGCADALHFDTAQTVTIDGDQFQGNDFDVHFSGTGTLTINATGGSNITTSRVSGGGTVVINNNVSVTFIGLKDNTEVRVYTANTITELDGVENATDGTVDNRSVTFSLAAATTVDIRFANNQWIVPDRDAILDFVWPNSDSSIPITQVIDRSFNNP